MLHALGYYRPGTTALERDGDWALCTPEAVAAVNAFRAAEGLAGPSSGVPAGLVDAETVDRLWKALDKAGKGRAVRERLLDATGVLR